MYDISIAFIYNDIYVTSYRNQRETIFEKERKQRELENFELQAQVRLESRRQESHQLAAEEIRKDLQEALNGTPLFFLL